MTCGSVIKFQHIGTGYRSVLPHSHSASPSSHFYFDSRCSSEFAKAGFLPPSFTPGSSHSSPSSPSSSSSPTLPLSAHSTSGMTVPPRSILCRLHSHDVKWGSGSTQQSGDRVRRYVSQSGSSTRHVADVSPVPYAVTANQNLDDHNSLWIIRGAHGEHCPQGTPVRDGMKIRLTHHATRQNLHSHLHASPLSRFSRPSHPTPQKATHTPWLRSRCAHTITPSSP